MVQKSQSQAEVLEDLPRREKAGKVEKKGAREDESEPKACGAQCGAGTTQLATGISR
jgi:hypothetical protein